MEVEHENDGPKSKVGGECRWLEERLGSYVDGELGSRAMTRANRHLGECPRCRREVAFMEESLEEVRGLRTAVPGSDFEAAIWQRIRIAQSLSRAHAWRARPGWGRWDIDRRSLWAGATVAAAAAALLLIFVVPGIEFGTPTVVTGDRDETNSALVASGGSAGQDVSPSAGREGYAGTGGTSPYLLTGVLPEGSWPSATSGPPLPGETPEAAPASAAEEGQQWQGPREAVVYGRLEPSLIDGELMLDRVHRVRDPWVPERGDYPMRQVVVARPGEVRISF